MREKSWFREYGLILAAGVAVGIAALILTASGNPKNMGFCIACFLRDIAGALGFHSAATVQYIRPEIIGIVVGAAAAALAAREFRAKAGASPACRFVLGMFVMIGALVFLGCPLRMVIRLGGGDLTAVAGLVGFIAGILVGVVCLKKGFSLGRAYPVRMGEGFVLSGILMALLGLLLLVPTLLKFSEAGPGSMRAFWGISLAAGLVVGVLAQRSRLCMAGGIRDAVMLRDFKLLSGFLAIWGTVTIGNLVLGFLQPVRTVPAHRPQPVPLVRPGHGPGGLGFHPAGRLPPATVDSGRRGQRRLRRDRPGHDRGRRRLPQLRSGRRGGFRGGGRHLCGRRHRHCRHGGGCHRIRGTAGHHGDPFAENGGCIA